MLRIVSQLLSRLFALIYIVLIAIVLTLTALSYTMLKLIGPVDLLIGVGLVGLVWVVRAFVINREIEVGTDEAKIVRRWRGHPEVIYRGTHRLKFGDRVTAAYSLRATHYAGNEESLTSRDGYPLRVRSNFRHHIANPIRYTLRGKKCERRLAALNRESLEEEIGRFSLNDLWNCPAESNQAIRDNLSRKLKDAGIEVSDFRLEEVILPEKAVKWRRTPSLQNYWQEFALVSEHRSEYRIEEVSLFFETRLAFYLLSSAIVSFILLRFLTDQEVVIALGTLNLAIIGMWVGTLLAKIRSLFKMFGAKSEIGQRTYLEA